MSCAHALECQPFLYTAVGGSDDSARSRPKSILLQNCCSAIEHQTCSLQKKILRSLSAEKLPRNILPTTRSMQKTRKQAAQKRKYTPSSTHFTYHCRNRFASDCGARCQKESNPRGQSSPGILEQRKVGTMPPDPLQSNNDYR